MKKNRILIIFIILCSSISISSEPVTETSRASSSSDSNIDTQEKPDSITTPFPKILALMSPKNELINIVMEFTTSEGFIFWNCREYLHGGETLFQIGYFNSPESEITIGFIISDKPFLQEIFWTTGTPMPGEQIKPDELPKGKILTPFGIAPSAEVAMVSKEGLDYSWRWGDAEKGESYVIVMHPDGAVLYYNMTNVGDGKSVKPSGVYRAYKE